MRLAIEPPPMVSMPWPAARRWDSAGVGLHLPTPQRGGGWGPDELRHRLGGLAQTGIPAEVRRFLAAEIESVKQLEVLLLLRGIADKHWTADEVARAGDTTGSRADAA